MMEETSLAFKTLCNLCRCKSYEVLFKAVVSSLLLLPFPLLFGAQYGVAEIIFTIVRIFVQTFTENVTIHE
jgi:hypothetical protein